MQNQMPDIFRQGTDTVVKIGVLLNLFVNTHNIYMFITDAKVYFFVEPRIFSNQKSGQPHQNFIRIQALLRIKYPMNLVLGRFHPSKPFRNHFGGLPCTGNCSEILFEGLSCARNCSEILFEGLSCAGNCSEILFETLS
jgi:hypothetical protein